MMIKLKKLIFLASALLLAVFFAVSVFAAGKIEKLSVIDISTPEQPGYAIYWPAGQGKVTLMRGENGQNFSAIADVDGNFFVDYSAKSGVAYSYRVGGEAATVADQLSGKSVISEIKIEEASVTPKEASVVVKFQTDKLARSQIAYGESLAYSYKTELDENLNQSHVILIEKLKPGTTYHFSAKAADKTGKEAVDSPDQTFTTSLPPQDVSIFEIIIKALSQAFSGFESWMGKE